MILLQALVVGLGYGLGVGELLFGTCWEHGVGFPPHKGPSCFQSGDLPHHRVVGPHQHPQVMSWSRRSYSKLDVMDATENKQLSSVKA